MRAPFLASTAIAGAFLCSIVTAAPPKSAAPAPNSWSCSVAIYNPVECRPPRLIKFEFKDVIPLATHVTPTGSYGAAIAADPPGAAERCLATTDDQRSNGLAPIVCNGLRAGYSAHANEDGVIGCVFQRR